MAHKNISAAGATLGAAALAAGFTAGCSGNAHVPAANTTPSGMSSSAPSAPSATAALQASATAPAATPTPAQAAGLPRCIVTDLSPAVHVVAGSQGAGHELLNITLTNTSGHVCRTYGFPGLQLEDRNSAGQATNVIRDFSVKPTTLVVDSGASVSAMVRFDFDVPAGDEPKTGACEAPSVYLTIIPPEEGRAMSASITGGPVTVCNHGTLDLLPLVSGVTGPNR
jgi:hypothetical protein